MKQIVSKVLKKIENVFKIKNSKMSKRQLKLIIPAAVCLFVFVVALSGKVLLSSLTSSVYNITDLNNLDNVNVGDAINYDINGYSDWRVLSVDKENGTIEVTSNTNVKDLTIEPYKSVDEYNQLFQNEASAYNDNNYVVSTRTINKADSLLLGDVDEEFWLANVNERSLMTNKSNADEESIIYTDTSIPLNEFYVVPFITIKSPLGDMLPNIGDEIDLSSNGIDRWFYSGQTFSDGQYGEVLVYLPITPVQLYVYNLDNLGSVSQAYFNSYNKNGILGYGNWLDRYSHNFNGLINLYNGKNVFDNEKKTMYFVAETGRKTISEDGKYNIKKSYGDPPGTVYYKTEECLENNNWNEDACPDVYDSFIEDSQIFMYDTTDSNSSNGSKDRSLYYVPKTLTFGYRPVLTLKVNGSSNENVNNNDNDDNEGSNNDIEDNRHEVNNELEIGNYVKYDANGYRNWRVLSIDVSAGTVDVISGGIVKNLSLYGKADYENYEDILQREVDAYKVGNRAVKARAVQESDIDMLNNIGDEVGGMYWFNRKTELRLDAYQNIQTSVIYNEYSYDVGVLSANNYYEDDTTDGIKKYWVKLYAKPENRSEVIEYEGTCMSWGSNGPNYYDCIQTGTRPLGDNDTGNGDLNYIAGLRPIITLSLKEIEMLSNDEVNDVINQSNSNNQSYVEQQKSSNNNSYISPIRKYSSGTGSSYYGSGSSSYGSGSSGNYSGSSGSSYNGNYSYGDEELTNSVNNSGSMLFNFKKTNWLLGWLVLIAFVYGLVFAAAIIGIVIYLIKKAYTK